MLGCSEWLVSAFFVCEIADRVSVFDGALATDFPGVEHQAFAEGGFARPGLTTQTEIAESDLGRVRTSQNS